MSVEPITDLITELCAVDPEHFGTGLGGGFYHFRIFDAFGYSSKVTCEIAGWMLEQMPEGTFCCWHLATDQFACWVRTKEGYDVGVHGARGFGKTRIEAITRAYIQWRKTAAGESAL